MCVVVALVPVDVANRTAVRRHVPVESPRVAGEVRDELLVRAARDPVHCVVAAHHSAGATAFRVVARLETR